MKPFIGVCIPLILVLSSARPDPASQAANQATGTASGTLTIEGKTFKLTKVRALEQPNPFDEKKKIIRVVLSDVPVPEKALKDNDAMMDLILDEKLHTIEFTFTPEGETFGGELYYDMKSHGFSPGTFGFEKKFFDAKRASGKVSAKETDKKALMRFACTATFDAPVER
jgi:hypothetical protein